VKSHVSGGNVLNFSSSLTPRNAEADSYGYSSIDMQGHQLTRETGEARATRRRGVGGHRAAPGLRFMLAIALGAGAVIGVGTGAALATFAGEDDGPAGGDQLIAATSEADDAGLVTQSAEPSPDDGDSDDTDESDDPEPQPEPDDPHAALAAEVVDLTNAEREAAGCPAVKANEELATAATGHSSDMATNDYFDHTSQDGRTFTDRASAAGYDDAMSENIAAGYPTAAAVVEGWMNSPGHRANILNCDARAVGLGVAEAGDGTLYWTQMFGRA